MCCLGNQCIIIIANLFHNIQNDTFKQALDNFLSFFYDFFLIMLPAIFWMHWSHFEVYVINSLKFTVQFIDTFFVNLLFPIFILLKLKFFFLYSSFYTISLTQLCLHFSFKLVLYTNLLFIKILYPSTPLFGLIIYIVRSNSLSFHFLYILKSCMFPKNFNVFKS